MLIRSRSLCSFVGMFAEHSNTEHKFILLMSLWTQREGILELLIYVTVLQIVSYDPWWLQTMGLSLT